MSTTQTGVDRDVEPDPQAVLDALTNPRSRAIVAALGHQPRTVEELTHLVDLPRSTLYRHLGHLTDAGFVRESIRFDPDGRHASQYARTVSDVAIAIDTEGVLVEVH